MRDEGTGRDEPNSACTCQGVLSAFDNYPLSGGFHDLFNANSASRCSCPILAIGIQIVQIDVLGKCAPTNHLRRRFPGVERRNSCPDSILEVSVKSEELLHETPAVYLQRRIAHHILPDLIRQLRNPAKDFGNWISFERAWKRRNVLEDLEEGLLDRLPNAGKSARI